MCWCACVACVAAWLCGVCRVNIRVLANPTDVVLRHPHLGQSVCLMTLALAMDMRSARAFLSSPTLVRLPGRWLTGSHGGTLFLERLLALLADTGTRRCCVAAPCVHVFVFCFCILFFLVFLFFVAAPVAYAHASACLRGRKRE